MLEELRERLGSELERLAQELSVTAPAGPGAHVDAAVYRPQGEREREIQLRVRRLGQFIAGLAKLDPKTLWYDRAGFGSLVELQNLGTKERISYTLVTGEVIDLDEDQVSLASPIGQALLGRKAGDRVAVDTPQGMKRFRILSVRTLPQVVGVGELPTAAASAPASGVG